MGRDVLIRFAREWGKTALLTKGKCTVIIGAGVNHWYHGNLMYRAAIHALMFCGCVGVNGGGLAHYVGQEKLAPRRVVAVHRVRAGLDARRAPAECAELALRHTPISGATKSSSPIITPFPRPGSGLARVGPHHGRSGPRGAQRLAAVLSPIQPQSSGSGARGRTRPAPRRRNK